MDSQKKEYMLASQNFGDGDHLPLHLKGEIQFDDAQTTIKMFRDRTEMYGNRPCLAYRAGMSTQSDKIVNDYKILTFSDCDKIVTILAKAFRALGIEKGECVGIYAKNSPYWLLCDFALAAIGAIVCPLYDTLGPHKISYCIRNSNVKTILTQDEYMNNVVSISKRTPMLKRVINIDDIDISSLYSEISEQNTMTINSKTVPTIEQQAVSAKTATNIKTSTAADNLDILTSEQFAKIAENIRRKALPSYIQLYEIDAIGGETSITLSASHSLYSLGSSVSAEPKNDGIFPVGAQNVNSNDNNEEEDVSPEEILKDMRQVNCDLYTELYNVIQGKPRKDENSLFITYFNLLLPIITKSIKFTKYETENEKDKKEYNYEILKKISQHEFKHVDYMGHIDEIVSYVYTSGTSGAPKACCHSSRSLLAGGANMCYRYFPYHITEPRQNMISTTDLICKVKDYEAPLNLSTKNVTQSSFLSFLPLAHIFERAAEYAAIIRGNIVYYYTGSTKTLLSDISKAKPTIFIGVPRVYTKIQAGIMKKVMAKPKAVQKLFFASMWLKLAIQNFSNSARTSGECYLLDKIVFKEVQKAMGGNVKFIVSGSSALPKDTFMFLRTTIGGHLTQGFGCTETGATGCYVAAGQKISDIFKEEEGFTNPIGMPCGGVLMKVIDRSDVSEYSLERDHVGELCIKGPCMGSFYLHETKLIRSQKEDESDISSGLVRSSRQLLDDDGWYHTNDLVKFDIKEKTIKLSNLDPCDIKTREDALYKSNHKSCLCASDFAMNLFMDSFDPLYTVTRKGTGIGIDVVDNEEKRKALIVSAKTKLKKEMERAKNYTVDEATSTLTIRENQISYVRRIELVVKTQQGEFIDLNAVEEALEKNPLITYACVHATADKAFPAAVLDIDSQVLLTRLNNDIDSSNNNENGNNSSGKRAYTIENLHELYDRDSEHRYENIELKNKIDTLLDVECRKCLKRANLKNFCLPKAFFLEIDQEWANNTVFMTSTMKKQHKNIVNHFHEEFNHMFTTIDKTIDYSQVQVKKGQACCENKTKCIFSKVKRFFKQLF